MDLSIHKYNKWKNIKNYSLYNNIILSKMPIKGSGYDFKDIKEKYDIKCIIDLTDEEIMYDRDDNITYNKLNLNNKKIPSEEDILSFINIINNNNNCFILVHCRYGLNRTGFMFTNYLIRERKYDNNKAIEYFKNIREPGIKKDYLLKKLIQ